MKKTAIALGILLGFNVGASALSIEETLTATYKNNSQLQGVQQKYLQDIESYQRTFSEFLPDIGAQVSVANSKSKADSQFAQPKNHSFENGPNVSRGIGIKQNIFAGGGSVIKLKIAQATFVVLKTTLQKGEQQVLLSAIQAYLDVCAARANYSIAQDSLKSAQQNLHTVEEKLKAGEATITELSRAKADLASAQASESGQHAALLGTYAKFYSVTGIEATEDMDFPDIPKDLPETQDQFMAIVNKSNLDLISAKYQLSQAKDGTKAAMVGLLPSADISLQAAKAYNKDGSTLREGPNNPNAMSYTTSLTVNIPIYDKGQSHSGIRQQKKIARQAVAGLDSTEKQLKAIVVGSWEKYTASKDAIVYADKAVEANKLAMEGTQQEYQVGSKTLLEVLTSQDALNKARSEAIKIKQNYILTAYQMKDLMGQMTAPALKLPVSYFNPDLEYRKVKRKIIGF